MKRMTLKVQKLFKLIEVAFKRDSFCALKGNFKSYQLKKHQNYVFKQKFSINFY